jgi:hypothetical protein
MDTLNANERSLGRALGKRALVYIGILVLIFALVLILNTSNASAAGPTPVTGPIAADTDWNATGSPYYVTGSVTAKYYGGLCSGDQPQCGGNIACS